MFRRVRLQLTAYVVAVLALVLLAVGILVYVLIARQFDQLVDAELRASVARVPAFGGPARNAAERDALTRETAADDSEGPFVVQFLSGIGPRPFGPGRGQPPTPLTGWHEAMRRGPVPAGIPDMNAVAATRPGKDDLRTVTLDGQSYRLLTRVSGAEGREVFASQAGISLAARDQQERSVLLALAGGGLLGLALTLAGGLFLTGRALAPLRLAFARQRRFIGDASHELRTPLALLRLEAEQIGARTDTAAVRPLVRQVDRLSRLVDDLLTLARLDQDALPLEHEPVYAASLLRTAATEAQSLAGGSVSVVMDAPADLWLSGDPDRLHQLLLILVDNAVRATPPGGQIVLSAMPDTDLARITVVDSGPGIPTEHLEHVFERFSRIDTARVRGSGGTGLGLAIARDLVRAHGGEIAIASPPAGGTRVTLRLPSLAAPSADAEATPAAMPVGSRTHGDPRSP